MAEEKLFRSLGEIVLKHSKWWIKFLISYIYIGIFPVLLLGIFFYSGYKMSVYKEIENSNYSFLTQALYKTDNMVEKMNSIAYHLSGTYAEGNDLREYSGRMPEVDDAIIMQQLKTYNGLIEGVPIQTLLYIRGGKYIYTEDGKTLYMDFEASKKDYGDLTMSSFFGMINSLKYNTSIKLYQPEGDDSQNQSLVYYLYPVPYMESLPVATLCFSVQYSDMYGALENYLGSLSADVYLYNEYYRNIFSSALNKIKAEDRTRLEEAVANIKGTGVFERKIDNKSYVIMRGVSLNSGFSIVTVSEKEAFYSRADSFEKTMLIVVVLLSAIAVALAIVLSKRSYNPIKQLLHEVTGKNMPEDEKSLNEFEIIQSYWSDIKHKNQELNSLVDRQRPIIVASALHTLLERRISDSEEIDFVLKSANISLLHPYFFVIMIPLPLPDSMEQDISKSILSLVHGRVNPLWHLYGIDMIMENSIAVIVNCAAKEIEGEDARKTVAGLIQSEILKIWRDGLNLMVGRIYEQTSDINASYIETTVIASDYPIRGTSEIICFEQISQGKQDNKYPVLEQAIYIQCIKQANKDAALKALEEMIGVISDTGSYLITQCLCYDIINMIIKTVNQLKGFDMNRLEIKRMCAFSSLEEFRQSCITVTELICDQYEAFKESEHLKLRSGIINYVSSNYTELSMCLDDVANQFDVTANYVSRFFKQETGCSFIQYITMLRMDRAKELLITTDIQVKEIVSSIGYIDVANFIRKFKSYEGITPNQYREAMRGR